jgi:amino acid transporter
MMQVISIWGPLIYAGCFAATLSTALTNLLSVPRLIQALGIDRIYPGLLFFSKGYGKAGEPYRGYVLTFIISTAFLLIGKFLQCVLVAYVLTKCTIPFAACTSSPNGKVEARGRASKQYLVRI